MNLPVSLPEELWSSLCEEHLVRPAVVAAGRARVASGDWPAALEVADAVLADGPRQPVAAC